MVFNDFLLGWKRNKCFPHSLIIKNNFCCNFKTLINKYLKTLVCKDFLFCDQCNDCQRIERGYYPDLIYFENTQEKPIKKEDIINIEKRFSYDALGDNFIKLYVIKNIENASKQVMNSLLKFIEEPPPNTYALFFCSNEANLLSTIKSRSQIIHINDFEKINHKNKEIDEILSLIFLDIDEYENFRLTYDFDNLFSLAKKAIKINDVQDEINIFNQLKLLDKNELNVLLRILLVFCKSEQKPKIIDLQSHLKLNINKNTFIMKLLEEIN